MENLMKAICLDSERNVRIQEVTRPEKALPGHLLIEMEASGINAGDKAFIAGVFPEGSIPVSRYGICGVSGVGRVTAVGDGAPSAYKGKRVAVYRSLRFGDDIVGTWCETAHLPYLQCAVLPDDVEIEDYSGSLVNTMTPYAFVQQVMEEGHKGILCTAGNSATGIALLGICIRKGIPVLSIARTDAGKNRLGELGAKDVLVQAAPDFKPQLAEKTLALQATAVFDGVGGEILNQITDVLPVGSGIYCYGFLGGKAPWTFHTSLLMKGITIRGFGNFRTKTVQDRALLSKALIDISTMIGMPHFKTNAGPVFRFEDIHGALAFSSTAGEKAILRP
jgi:NADPH:quinone reductase-like Zn-dependent oxidoreductase